jgi:hypothetical protein
LLGGVARTTRKAERSARDGSAGGAVSAFDLGFERREALGSNPRAGGPGASPRQIPVASTRRA